MCVCGKDGAAPNGLARPAPQPPPRHPLPSLLSRTCRRRVHDVAHQGGHRVRLGQKVHQPPVERARLLHHVVLVQDVGQGEDLPVQDGVHGGGGEGGDAPEHEGGGRFSGGRGRGACVCVKRRCRFRSASDWSAAAAHHWTRGGSGDARAGAAQGMRGRGATASDGARLQKGRRPRPGARGGGGEGRRAPGARQAARGAGGRGAGERGLPHAVGKSGGAEWRRWGCLAPSLSLETERGDRGACLPPRSDHAPRSLSVRCVD